MAGLHGPAAWSFISCRACGLTLVEIECPRLLSTSPLTFLAAGLKESHTIWDKEESNGKSIGRVHRWQSKDGNEVCSDHSSATSAVQVQHLSILPAQCSWNLDLLIPLHLHASERLGFFLAQLLKDEVSSSLQLVPPWRCWSGSWPIYSFNGLIRGR